MRLLTATDAAALARLRARAYETDSLSFAGAPGADPTLDPVQNAARLATQSLAAGNVVIGAFTPELVGMLGLVRELAAKTRHKAFLWGFYVDPTHQRRGIGTALLREAARLAQEMGGVEQLTLRASATADAALAFYARMGFETWGREPRALKADDRYLEELHMIAPLERLLAG